jgi:hypothetical protein
MGRFSIVTPVLSNGIPVMNRLTLTACLLAFASTAFALDGTETTRKTFSAASQLEVRNINGLIRVTASNTSSIQLVATRIIHADDAAALAVARNELTLDVQESGGQFRLCVMHYRED